MAGIAGTDRCSGSGSRANTLESATSRTRHRVRTTRFGSQFDGQGRQQRATSSYGNARSHAAPKATGSYAAPAVKKTATKTATKAPAKKVVAKKTAAK